MELKTANHSHYPRIGETKAQHHLRKAYHQFDRKQIDLNELNRIQQETTRAVIHEQDGLDVVTDGQILWNDPVSHLMKKMDGVKIGGLLRFFDTNFYFRQPIVVGPVKKKSDSLLKEEMSFLLRETKRETKAVLTGPYTLACLSVIQTDTYKSARELADALTSIIADEVKVLSDLGVKHIQIDEPAYGSEAPDWSWALQTVEKLAAAKGNAKLGVTVYFNDVQPIYDELQKLPVDFIGLDCTYSKDLVSHIKNVGSPKDLELGVLDGRNTKLEDSIAISKVLSSLEPCFKDRTLTITTSCGLEYLPRNRAQEKLKLLKAIQHEYKKGE